MLRDLNSSMKATARGQCEVGLRDDSERCEDAERECEADVGARLRDDRACVM